MVSDISWALPSRYDRPGQATLAPYSRMASFFTANNLGFRNIASAIYAAESLKKILIDQNSSDDIAIKREIIRLNNLPSAGAVKIDEKIYEDRLKGPDGKAGKAYRYAVFNFAKESAKINVLFLAGHEKLTPDERAQLVITDDKKHHLDCPGLEGVWFVKTGSTEGTGPGSGQAVVSDGPAPAIARKTGTHPDVSGKEPPTIDITISDSGSDDLSREGHDKYHGNLRIEIIKIQQVLRRAARKHGVAISTRPHRGNMQHWDIRKAVQDICNKTGKDRLMLDVQGKIVTLWIEDGILIVKDPNFSVNHAGRNEMAVYARDDRAVVHEKKELELWCDFAFNPSKYGVYNTRVLPPGSVWSPETAWKMYVGDAIMEWANKKVENRLPVDRKPVAEKLRKEFHQKACQAEFKYLLNIKVKDREMSRDIAHRVYQRLPVRAVEYMMNNGLDISVVSFGAAGLEPDLLTVVPSENRLIISEECFKHSSQWFEYRMLTYIHYRRLIGEQDTLVKKLAAEIQTESSALLNIYIRCHHGERFAPDIMSELRRFGKNVVYAWSLRQEAELFQFVKKRFVKKMTTDERRELRRFSDNDIDLVKDEIAGLLKRRLNADKKEKPVLDDIGIYDPPIRSDVQGDDSPAEPRPVPQPNPDLSPPSSASSPLTVLQHTILKVIFNLEDLFEFLKERGIMTGATSEVKRTVDEIKTIVTHLPSPEEDARDFMDRLAAVAQKINFGIIEATFNDAYKLLPEGAASAERRAMIVAGPLASLTFIRNAIMRVLPGAHTNEEKVQLNRVLDAGLLIFGAYGEHVKDYGAGPIEITVNEPVLMEIVGDIMQNANEAFRRMSYPKGGRFSIAIRGPDEKGYVEILFEDNAGGMTQEQVDAFNADKPVPSSKGRARGGIGLMAVKDHIKDLGGTVSLESRHVSTHPADHGTTVTIRLPITGVGRGGAGNGSRDEKMGRVPILPLDLYTYYPAIVRSGTHRNYCDENTPVVVRIDNTEAFAPSGKPRDYIFVRVSKDGKRFYAVVVAEDGRELDERRYFDWQIVFGRDQATSRLAVTTDFSPTALVTPIPASSAIEPKNTTVSFDTDDITIHVLRNFNGGSMVDVRTVAAEKLEQCVRKGLANLVKHHETAISDLNGKAHDVVCDIYEFPSYGYALLRGDGTLFPAIGLAPHRTFYKTAEQAMKAFQALADAARQKTDSMRKILSDGMANRKLDMLFVCSSNAIRSPTMHLEIGR
ncbi:MAG: ATP-binding protein, partial [Candidatus Omnitrophica bacterium]|nr:ATP-binding protein [Candidatus Omnitrophota bacterium]